MGRSSSRRGRPSSMDHIRAAFASFGNLIVCTPHVSFFSSFLPTTRAPCGRRAQNRPVQSIPVGCAPVLASLQDFLSKAGIRLHNCSLGECPDGGRCLVATAPIESGQRIVEVPRAALIRADGGSHHGWWFALVLALLRESKLSRRSYWHPYIASLPENPYAPLWASERFGVLRVAEQLRPYGLSAHVRRYWTFLNHVFQSCRNDIPMGTTWRDFVWAVSIVQSRAFRIDKESITGHPLSVSIDSAATGTFALIPGLDLLNHSVHMKTSFRLDAEADSVYIVSGTTFSADDQVLISYGAKSNRDLLFFYGFVEGNNPADKVDVVSRGILRRVAVANPGAVLLQNEKSRLLHEAGLVQDDKTYYVRRDSLDHEIMAILRVCFASVSEFSSLDSATLRTKRGILHSLSLPNELSAWHCIAGECERQLDALPPISETAALEAEQLRLQPICSSVWDWERGGHGDTVAEALLVAEKRELLSATWERVRHYANISKAIGRVSSVLLPPTQKIISTTLYDSGYGSATPGVHSFHVDFTS